ncbi:MAG: lamin tail domain-containing protein [Verrucomicrobiales bacterium]
MILPYAFSAAVSMKLRLFVLLCSVWLCSLSQAQVLISEIMYHPFEEGQFDAAGNPTIDLSEEVHEFLELHNAGSQAASLTGWKISGGIDYSFPNGATIPAKGFIVIAKNKQRLAALPAYGLQESNLYGPYDGQLSNSGELLRLRDARGVLIDSVEYSPAFPWPIGANKFGADAEFTGLNHMLYNFRGRSLERLSYQADSNDPANWIASPIPGEPSPGSANSQHVTELPPVVISFQVLPTNGEVLARKTVPVRIEATFSKLQISNPTIEFFDDNINLTNEVKSVLAMERSPDSPFTYVATLPGKGDRVLVRFRFRSELGESVTVISPRPSDPYQWHSYFVSPARISANTVNDLFISNANLSRLQANLSHNPNSGYIPAPSVVQNGNWNKMVPGVLVRDGVVYDIQVRYNGSFFRRSASRQSYKVEFPDYQQLDGQGDILLTDKDYMTIVGHKLFSEAGLPTSKTEWTDLYVNTNAKLVRLQLEEHDRRLLRNYHELQAALTGNEPDEPGRIFKSSGILNDVGPYGKGNGSVLRPISGFTSAKRYEWVYSSKNADWRGYKGFADMIAGLNAARGSNPAANAARIRQFLEANFDIDKSLTYLAVRNWMSTWDDTVHNYYIWQQSNGKYSFLPWDFDSDMGLSGDSSSTKSIYRGENGNGDNTHGDQIFKDSFFKAFKTEYNKKLFFLNNTVLHPDNIRAMGLNYNSVTNFAKARHAYVNSIINLGSFEKPNQPTALALSDGSSVLSPARLIASPYDHSSSSPPRHAKTHWRISNRNEQVIYSLISTNDLTSLEVPFEKLDFGQIYSWQAIYEDELGAPSIPSERSYFRFGGDSKRRSIFSLTDSSEWKYNQTGINLATSWRSVTYNDSTWSSGPQPIGTGVVIAGPVPKTPLTVGKVTYYFRKSFVFDGSPSQAFCLLQLIVDDGAVVYLNNRELFRTNMPTTTISYSTFANKHVGNPTPTGFMGFPGTALVQGTNVIAVEVHQNTAASADIMFGLGLDITFDDSPGVVVLNEVLARAEKTPGFGAPQKAAFIELTASGTRLDLSGYALSNDPKNPGKFIFPAGTFIEPFSFLHVELGGNSDGSTLRAPFTISKDGGSVLLYKPGASGFVLQDAVEFGIQAANYSIGRVPGIVGNWTLNEPTPGGENIKQSIGASTSTRINEWMADPVSGPDWLELYNSSSLPIDIGDNFLSDSHTNLRLHKLPPLSFIGPRRSHQFFASEDPVGGANHLNFKLSSGGESVIFSNPSGVAVQTVAFTEQKTGVSQGRLPDGGSMISPFENSASPGSSNYKPVENVRFNELVSNPLFPQEAAVELHNHSGAPLDISNWWLSDDETTLQKYQIPAGTTIEPNSYLVFYAYQFDAPELESSAFNLNPAGGDLFLSAVASTGLINGNRLRLSYAPMRQGVSQGVPAGAATDRLATLQKVTLGSEAAVSLQEFRLGTGSANARAAIPDLVVSEIMYHPPNYPNGVDNPDHEFIELQNISPFDINLTPSALEANGWMLFETAVVSPTPITLAPGEYLLLVTFDPATDIVKFADFRAKYKLDANVRVYGPLNRKLSNSSDLVQLNEPVLIGQHFAWLPVDEVLYRDASPWPRQPDGDGPSLQRKDLHISGNNFDNWTAANPTPGKGNYVDNDGDGMADVWELQSLLDPANAADAFLDADGDGLSNLAEFRAQLDPRDPADTLALTLAMNASTSGLELNLGCKPGMVYIIEAVEELGGVWQPAFAFRATEEVTSFELPPNIAQSGRFYRVRVP